ncbi:MAG: histidine phosphatase family protein [Spirochaetales bacterium]|nr:histidine phosphatase family protein [Spirochaetales bacterium]
MRIGLLRHLPVAYKYSFFGSSQEFHQAIQNYDRADIIYNKKADLGVWDICYASSMKRARKTARFFHDGKVIETDLLKEVPLNAVVSTRLRLPLLLWAFFARLAWSLNSKSQPETKYRTLKRARHFLKTFCFSSSSDTLLLIVSHGLFLLNLQRVLREYGFKGKTFFIPRHATLYVYEK